MTGAVAQERRPWMLDPRPYPVMTGLGPDGLPRITRLLRRDFPPAVVRSKHNAQLNWGLSEGWRCFLSGVSCHWAPPAMYDGPSVRLIPWALSIEHLASLHLARLRGADATEWASVCSLRNQVVVGRELNRKAGHNPLALKLLSRQTLRDVAYDRDDPSDATFRTILAHVIGLEDGLRLHGLYPWQPWTYADATHRRAADDFMLGMSAFEGEFLRVPTGERDAFLEAFSWSW